MGGGSGAVIAPHPTLSQREREQIESAAGLPFSLSLRAEGSPVLLRFAAISLMNENKTVTAMTGSG